MKWTYLCKWILAILVVVGLSYLHLPQPIYPKNPAFCGSYLDCGDVENFQAYEK